MSALLILLAVIVIGVVIAYWFPETTERWVRKILFARRIVFGAAGLIVAFIFIGTGNVFLVLIGAASLLIMIWVGWFEVTGEGVL